jgi:hypothetical protein
MKQNKRRRQSKEWNARAAAPWALSFLVVFGLGLGWVFYKQRQPAAEQQALTAYLAEVKDWMGTRKQRLQKEVAEVKAMAADSDNPAAKVHFEFYTSLGKMQVGVNPAPKVASLSDKIMKPEKPKLIVSRADDLEKDVLSALQSYDNN